MFRKLLRNVILWAVKEEVVDNTNEQINEVRTLTTYLASNINTLQKDITGIRQTVIELQHIERANWKNRNARKAMRNGV